MAILPLTKAEAIFNENYSSPKLTNVTFSDNSATNSGGGIHNYNSSNPTMNNVILWGNSAPSGPQIFNNTSTPIITYSLIQGSGGSGAGWDTALGTDDGGNIDADPRFADSASGDLHLLPGSPAIDAGDNSAVPVGVTTDRDGSPRFIDMPSVADTGSGTAPIVDMGAYEALADIILIKTVSPATIALAEPITFTMSITNSGIVTVSQVVITDTIAASILVNSVISSGLIITDTGYSPAYVWQVQDLAPGDSGVITITGIMNTPISVGVYTNTAQIAFGYGTWTTVMTDSVTYTVPIYRFYLPSYRGMNSHP